MKGETMGTKPNFELLDKAVAFAEEEPRRFNMETWFDHFPKEHEDLQDERLIDLHMKENDVPACGVVACLAGSVCIQAGICRMDVERDGTKYYHSPSEGWFEAAQKALGITDEQAKRLFYHTKGIAETNSSNLRWPDKFSKMYTHARTPAGRVRALKARVEYFKKTGK
jgi:hypothetical protein